MLKIDMCIALFSLRHRGAAVCIGIGRYLHCRRNWRMILYYEIRMTEFPETFVGEETVVLMCFVVVFVVVVMSWVMQPSYCGGLVYTRCSAWSIIYIYTLRVFALPLITNKNINLRLFLQQFIFSRGGWDPPKFRRRYILSTLDPRPSP